MAVAPDEFAVMHRTFVACLPLALLVALAVFGNPAIGRCDEVDDYVEAQRVALHVPGLALLVVKDAQIVKAQGYGLANVEHQVPVTAKTIFQLGSVGKQFTATGVMMLVEDGRLALADSVRKLLPDAPESWQAITVRHLLSHTAGLGDYPAKFDLTRDYREEDLAQAIYATPLEFSPGDRRRYSNLGYVTLGIVMHKVCGKPYGEFLDERIFKPLGMTATRIISEADIVPHRAAGYRLVNGELKNQQWVSPTKLRSCLRSTCRSTRSTAPCAILAGRPSNVTHSQLQAAWFTKIAGWDTFRSTSRLLIWPPCSISSSSSTPRARLIVFPAPSSTASSTGGPVGILALPVARAQPRLQTDKTVSANATATIWT